MKIRTLDQVIAKVADERPWRIREITMLKASCYNSNLSEQVRAVQRRAFIPIAYAHWEGFVKATGQAYLDFVASQRLKLAELTPASSPFILA